MLKRVPKEDAKPGLEITTSLVEMQGGKIEVLNKHSHDSPSRPLLPLMQQPTDVNEITQRALLTKARGHLGLPPV